MDAAQVPVSTSSFSVGDLHRFPLLDVQLREFEH
jgi:hypothetical protein